jgi:carboxyl-terminal processing protease
MKITIDRKLLVTISAVLILLIVSGALLGRVVAVEGTYGYLKLFNEALYLVVHNYVQPVDVDSLMQGAYRGMLESLDPGNEYLPPAKYQKASKGDLGGPAEVGLWLSKRRGYVVVVTADPGSPAGEAGIVAGDVIMRIDGTSTRTMGVWDATSALHGKPGSKVVLTLNPSNGAGRETVALVRKVVAPPVPTGSFVPPDVGVVRLAGIRDGDAKRLDQTIASLKSQGAQRLLLDMRGCVSDSLSEAIGVASLFIAQGSIVTVTDRYDGDKLYRADGRRVAWTRPLALLVDRGTARDCEVVTAALRDVAGASILGQPTWGIGTLQRLLPLRNDDGVLLAVGKYLSPAGKEWNGKGIEPDLVLEKGADETGDPQRQKAIDYLRGVSPAAHRDAA